MAKKPKIPISSKIELTKKNIRSGKRPATTNSLNAYRKGVKELTNDIEKSLPKGVSILDLKIALMEVVRRLETKMRRNTR